MKQGMKEIIYDNFKIGVTIIAFLVTLYVQHIENMQKITELEMRAGQLEKSVQQQYDRIDKMKVDKAVFEATISQFSSIKEDIKDIQADIKELIKKRR